jgi:D-alanyl-D-alanine dipeptidase
VLKASARIALANVPRQVFSANAAQAVGAAAQIEAGTIELTVRDLGSVDIGVVQYARAQNVSREEARKAIVESIKASSEDVATNPDAVNAVQALARFVETSGQTLVIKFTPLGKVPAVQLFQMLKTDPLIALAQFRIEASTGL